MVLSIVNHGNDLPGKVVGNHLSPTKVTILGTYSRFFSWQVWCVPLRYGESCCVEVRYGQARQVWWVASGWCVVSQVLVR